MLCCFFQFSLAILSYKQTPVLSRDHTNCYYIYLIIFPNCNHGNVYTPNAGTIRACWKGTELFTEFSEVNSDTRNVLLLWPFFLSEAQGIIGSRLFSACVQWIKNQKLLLWEFTYKLTRLSEKHTNYTHSEFSAWYTGCSSSRRQETPRYSCRLSHCFTRWLKMGLGGCFRVLLFIENLIFWVCCSFHFYNEQITNIYFNVIFCSFVHVFKKLLN